MDMIGKIRRLHARDKLSEREIARKMGLSRNTVSKWLSTADHLSVGFHPWLTIQAVRWLSSTSARTAVDDHSRIAFMQTYPDEKQASAVDFVRQATGYFASLRVPIQRVLTDNGPAFHSTTFAEACLELGIAQKFTRAYRPQTNGKAERFIQSALREWAYGRSYENSEQRRAALPAWNHFYNWHRPHHGIGCQPPMSRLNATGKTLLTLHP